MPFFSRNQKQTMLSPLVWLLLSSLPAAATAGELDFLLEPNHCTTILAVGQVIMGNPVAAAQGTLQVLDANNNNVCGGTAPQGAMLSVKIPSSLLQASNQRDYLIDVSESILLDTGNEPGEGCEATRAIHAGAMTKMIPLTGGSVATVRLLFAEKYGQAYAIPDCRITITGSRKVADPVGYLINQASVETFGEAVLEHPYSLTVEDLLKDEGQGYAIVVRNTGQFGASVTTPFVATKTIAGAADVQRIKSYLMGLSSSSWAVQLSILGFESSPSELEDIVLIEPCAGADSCPHFHVAPEVAPELPQVSGTVDIDMDSPSGGTVDIDMDSGNSGGESAGIREDLPFGNIGGGGLGGFDENEPFAGGIDINAGGFDENEPFAGGFDIDGGDQTGSGFVDINSPYEKNINEDSAFIGVDIDGDGGQDKAFVGLDIDGDGDIDGLDLDGDGKLEAIDIDGDGDIDGLDLDGDGQIEQGVDIDGDGTFDGIDIDGDGDIDVIDTSQDKAFVSPYETNINQDSAFIGVDIDGDGDQDKAFVGLDIDGDGDIDGLDLDGDGKLEAIDIDGDGDIDGLDLDGDGQIEQGVDIDGDGSFDGVDIDGDGDIDEIDLDADRIPAAQQAKVQEVCLQEGLCIKSSEVNEAAGTITVTVTNQDDAWFAVGFTTPQGGMTGGGTGSDIFACSSDMGLKRFNPVTSRTNPVSQDVSQELTSGVQSCSVTDTGGTMTFTRKLDGFRKIVPGRASPLIFARGPIGDGGSFAAKHPIDRRGQAAVDLTNISSGVTSVKSEVKWALRFHILFMTLAWGVCLPLAVVIASRTRNKYNEVIPGAKEGAWFIWHKSLAGMGWLFQVAGFLCIYYYVKNSAGDKHWSHAHSKLGLSVIIMGVLQPISAFMRPREPEDGWPGEEKPFSRQVFEIYHKGVGWTAMVCGMVNVFLGAMLVRDLDFETLDSNIAIIVATVGCTLFAFYFILCTVMPNNFFSRAIVFAPAVYVHERERAKEQARRVSVSLCMGNEEKKALAELYMADMT